MYIKASLLSVPATLFAVPLVNATCNAGFYTSNGVCVPCQAGYYQPIDNTNTQACIPAQPGWYADGFSAARQQRPCGRGKYSPGATSFCIDCPPGTQCTSETNPAPQPCFPGTFQPNGGPATSNPCPGCPPGQFNNVFGARACCNCCRGYYNENFGQTSCQKCNPQKPGGPEGSNDDQNCTVEGGSLSPPTCSQAPNNPVCPPTVNGGPSGGITRRDLGVRCARGYKRCPLLYGRGGYECVDIANDLESCGGCVDVQGSASAGVDCTAIEGTNDVKCKRGRCVIRSCRRGYYLTNEGLCAASFSVQDSHVVS